MTLVFSSDFETGNFSDWSDSSQAPLGSVRTAATTAIGGPTSPLFGTYLYEAHVHAGQTPIYGGERCDLIGGPTVSEGDEYWHSASFWLPPVANWAGGIHGLEWHSGSNEANQGQACMQMGMAPNPAGINFGYTNGSPGLIVCINGGNPAANGQQFPNINSATAGAGGTPWTSMTWDCGSYSDWTGRWIDVMTHIKFKSDLTGTFEFFRRDHGGGTWNTVVSQVGNVATIYAGHGNYMKLPLYRNVGLGATDGYIWYDNIKIGTTQADVDPPSSGGGGSPSVYRLPLSRGAATRVSNPSGRIAGLGGGGI